MPESLDLQLANRFNALILDPPPPDPRQRSLRFTLSSQESAIVPLEQITEVLSLPLSKLLPVPEMPPCVLGVCNWRGEMLWVIDFCDFAGYPPLQQESTSSVVMVMVVQVNSQSTASGRLPTIGVAVPTIGDIELHDFHHLQPMVPGLFAPGLLPLILGVLPERNEAVLNLKAIAHCPAWKSIGRKGFEIF